MSRRDLEGIWVGVEGMEEGERDGRACILCNRGVGVSSHVGSTGQALGMLELMQKSAHLSYQKSVVMLTVRGAFLCKGFAVSR